MKAGPPISLIAIMFFAFCLSCKDEEVVYTDVSGHWSFASDSYSGELQIIKLPNGEFNYVSGTPFTIDGTKYLNYTTRWSLDLSQSNTIGFFCLEVEITPSLATFNSLCFDNLIYSNDFKKMTSTEQQSLSCDCVSGTCGTSCVVNFTSEQIIFTRK